MVTSTTLASESKESSQTCSASAERETASSLWVRKYSSSANSLGDSSRSRPATVTRWAARSISRSSPKNPGGGGLPPPPQQAAHAGQEFGDGEGLGEEV